MNTTVFSQFDEPAMTDHCNINVRRQAARPVPQFFA
jgi:hypothetical protein